MKKFYSFSFLANIVSMLILCTSVNAQEFATITWGTARSQPTGTHEVHGEVVKGKLYIFGGYDINKKPNWTPTKRSYVYDPIADTWTAIADLPHTPNGNGFGGVTHEGLTNDGTNIYFAGGYTSNSDGTDQIFGTRQVWRYNVTSNNYTRLPDLPEALAAGQLRYLNGKIHYMGGANFTRADVNVHYALDLSNLAAGWKPLAPLLNPVNHPGSAVYGGKIYFVGGSHGQDDNTVTQKTLEAYDPVTNTWTKLADMPVARDHISSAVVVMGTRIIVLGGETSHNVLSNRVSAYTPATNTWTELTPLTSGKSAGVSAALNGNLYYTGGNFSTINRKGIPMTQSTLLPVADAFVRYGSFSAINYGKDTSLIIKSSTVSNYTRYSYLKFSLGNISNVSSAKLRIYGKNADNTTSVSLSSYGVNNDSWTETGITANNAPAPSTSVISASSITDRSKYYEFDVTSYVKSQLAGDKVVSLLIKDPANKNSNLIFKSKESGDNKPALIVSFTASRSDLDVSTNMDESETFDLYKNSQKPFIYPNPVNKRFNIKFPSQYSGDAAIEVIDPLGRVYKLGAMTIQAGGTNSIDISELPLTKGIYILKIQSQTTNDEIKLIVQ